jgi:hypothetical protein
MDRFLIAIWARFWTDYRGFWQRNWRSVILTSVVGGFASTFVRLQGQGPGQDLQALVLDAAWLALQGTTLSAAIFAVGAFLWCLVFAPARIWSGERQSAATLQARFEELVARQQTHLEFFVTDPSEPPFRFADPMVPDQDVITVGVRAAGVAPVHNIEIRIDKYAVANPSTPKVEINTVEPVEIVRGALMFGHARPGQPVYGQVLTVRQFQGAALPEVRVSYLHPFLSARYDPFPRGDWLLKLVASGEESPPAQAYFQLTVQDDTQDRVRLTRLSQEQIDRIVAEGGERAAIFVDP